jgi:two-component system chemotaxis response regulator CheB
MIASNPIRVLAVDESALFRKFLSDVLGKRNDIQLVGSAHDAYDARDRLRFLPVDVMTLDLDLPRMAGLTFLRLVMERKPMPVIVLSSQMPTGSQRAVEALIAGAAAVIEKPKNAADRAGFTQKLIRCIKTAAIAPKRRKTSVLKRILPEMPATASAYDPRQIIALGASTGGTQALESVLKSLPATLPGIVVVQHIPAGFSANFAARLNAECAMEVREAQHGDVVRPGLALVAPGNRHMEVQWALNHYRVALHEGPKVEHQRPSVDVLFKSLAHCAGKHTVAVLLTGMGQDGAAGMKQLHDLGARTIAQDAGSSVVYGMARKAVELKAVDLVVSLNHLAVKIVKALDAYRNPLTAHA